MIVVYAIASYLITGIIFAVYFAFFKVQKIDSNAHGTSFWFKLLLIPGAATLWPFLITKNKVDHS